MNDNLLTPSEVAKRLKVRRDVLMRYLRKGGRLHHLRVEVMGGKNIRISEKKLNKHISDSAVQ